MRALCLGGLPVLPATKKCLQVHPMQCVAQICGLHREGRQQRSLTKTNYCTYTHPARLAPRRPALPAAKEHVQVQESVGPLQATFSAVACFKYCVGRTPSPLPISHV
ncbi:hypothetical protein SCP_0301390 [Sparassis crispa]|uniref:Uncharacterized protein n=1 Tax=Sparassis crispa TaxID=139825 RepID=A0A401GE13_9APHY|nr:hypothetical protein SCP_0301390 [Sparassis crispa]GBE80424.1 hypothetical protein SCP_0301390 [Sparassis crispa]